ncbi:MAG: hypothetical protein JXA94_03365 [Parachlamydiales bacterium]|nr:hypothetical protein [Parachlamydiales bacterium]
MSISEIKFHIISEDMDYFVKVDRDNIIPVRNGFVEVSYYLKDEKTQEIKEKFSFSVFANFTNIIKLQEKGYKFTYDKNSESEIASTLEYLKAIGKITFPQAAKFISTGLKNMEET